MRGSKQLLSSKRTLSDAALDGLFGGLTGGVMMALYLITWGWFAHRPPETILGLFDGAMRGATLAGGVTHLMVSAVYGLLFGMIWRMLRLRVAAWLAGVVYGLILFTLAATLLLPTSGSPLAEIPPLIFALSHVIYGAVLGFVCHKIAIRAA